MIDAIYAARRETRTDLRDQVVLLLDHEEPIVRSEALGLLTTTWKIRDLRPRVRKVLATDEDSGVRARAAIGLASLASDETRKDDAEFLAKLFQDKRLDSVVRVACFEAISLLAGIPGIFELDDTDATKLHELLEKVAQQERK